MPAMIYDASAGAWKEAATPRIWDASAQVYKDSTGLVWDEQAQAWTERWGARETLFLPSAGITGDWVYVECGNEHSSMYNNNGFIYNKQIQNRKKLIVDLHLPSTGDQRFIIELGSILKLDYGTSQYRMLDIYDSPISDRQKLEFDISGACGYIQIYTHSNAHTGYGLEYSGNIGAEYMYLYRKYNRGYTEAYVYGVWVE